MDRRRRPAPRAGAGLSSPAAGRTRWERLIGGSVPPALRPLMAMVGLSVMSQYVVLAYAAIYAVREVDASDATVGLGLAVAATVGLAAGPVGGRLSDRRGRRAILGTGLAVQTAGTLALAVLPPRIGLVVAALVLFNMGMAIRWAAQQALVADLVVGSGREEAFAVMRTTFNVGAALGPVLGAGLLLVGWPAVFGGAAVLAALAWRLSFALPDERASARPASARAVPRGILAPALPLALGGAVLAWAVYNGFEVLLPVSLTESHGYAPAAWGLLFVLNPIMVVLGQVRIVGWTAHWTRRSRLVVAVLVMGASFLLVPLGASLPLVVLCVVGFTLGEMLWGPASQSLVADLAPRGATGTVMGILGSTTTAGVAIAGGGGLLVRDVGGDTAMWLAVAGCAAAAALVYALAERAAPAGAAVAGQLSPAAPSPAR